MLDNRIIVKLEIYLRDGMGTISSITDPNHLIGLDKEIRQSDPSGFKDGISVGDIFTIKNVNEQPEFKVKVVDFVFRNLQGFSNPDIGISFGQLGDHTPVNFDLKLVCEKI